MMGSLRTPAKRANALASVVRETTGSASQAKSENCTSFRSEGVSAGGCPGRAGCVSKILPLHLYLYLSKSNKYKPQSLLSGKHEDFIRICTDLGIP